jgi:acyl-CoA synthetase (NDP forming)
MRLIGPNCIGIVNTDPAVRLNGIFAPYTPVPGRVGFASQSGALGLAAIDYAGALELGISSFVSMGNKADISGNDLLNYWETDPGTDVILLYLESFGNPRKFARIAQRVGRTKPIVAVKSGRSPAGARAASSHTGALLAASDVTVDALFEQTGVIRTDTFQELFDVASLLASQPLPAGKRVGVVTNVGGPAILFADAAHEGGLEIPTLSDETQAALRALLPAEASVANPVDMIASATPAAFHDATRLVARDPNVDAVVSIFIQPLATRSAEIGQALADASRENQEDPAASGKPILAVFMGADGAPPELQSGSRRIPSYAFAESAAIALVHAVRYMEWRKRPAGRAQPLPGIQREAASAIVAEALGRGGGWLEPDEVARLLSCYGVPLVAQHVVSSVAAAAAAAREMDGPVALKAIVPGLVHKTDVGAVRLNLSGPAAVQRAAREMLRDFSLPDGVTPRLLVQQMAHKGVEMLVGIVQDPQFGPVVACGAGGVLVDLLQDVAVRLTPLTEQATREMVQGLKSYRLLAGYRGSAPADEQALVDVLLRISALAEDLPEVAELDCNPVMVLEAPHGAVVVDARVRVAPAAPPQPMGARRH